MTDDASLYIWSNQEGTVRFSGVAVSILGTGPSCLHIRTPDGSRSALVGTPSWRTPTPFEFTFPVTPGLNRLLLHAVLMGQVPEPFLLEAYPIMVTLQDGKLELTP
jgi:hypothetical protein